MPATAEKDHVYKIIDLVGSSEKGTDDALQNAISQAMPPGQRWPDPRERRKRW